MLLKMEIISAFGQLFLKERMIKLVFEEHLPCHPVNHPLS